MPRLKSNNALLDNVLKFLWKMDEVSIRTLKEERDKLKEERKMQSLQDFLFFLKYNLRKEQFDKIFKGENINKIYEYLNNIDFNDKNISTFFEEVAKKIDKISEARLGKQEEISNLNFEMLEKIRNTMLKNSSLTDSQQELIIENFEKTSIPSINEGKAGLNVYFDSLIKILEKYTDQLDKDVLKNIKKIVFKDLPLLQKKQKTIQNSFVSPLMEQLKYELLFDLMNKAKLTEKTTHIQENPLINSVEKNLKEVDNIDLELQYIKSNKNVIKANLEKKQKKLEKEVDSKKYTLKESLLKFVFRSWYKTNAEKELSKTEKELKQKDEELIKSQKKLLKTKIKKLNEINQMLDNDKFSETIQNTVQELKNLNTPNADKNVQSKSSNDKKLISLEQDSNPLIKETRDEDSNNVTKVKESKLEVRENSFTQDLEALVGLQQ